MSSPPPDAVIWKKNPLGKILTMRDQSDRGNRTRETAADTAERLLQIEPDSRELAWVRDQAGYYFATRDPEDSEFYPNRHERAGQPRYRWVDQGDGVRLGWLLTS